MSDETRQRVLEAAGPIFAAQGFNGATVREICAAAKVNLASVNYHFGSKETLYLETVRLAHRHKLADVPPPEWSSEAAPGEKLRIIVKTFLRRMLDTRHFEWPTRLLLREMLQPTHACKSIVEEYIRPQFEQLHVVVGELLPPGTTLEQRRRVAFSIVGQCLHYRAARGFISLLSPEEEQDRLYDIDALTEHITRFSLAAIEGMTSRSSRRNSEGRARRHERKRVGQRAPQTKS